MASVDDILPHLYASLHQRASRLVARRQTSVSPSSLVHDAVLRLYRVDPERWESEAHFRAVAAKAMRQVLIDRSRARNALKRGGDQVQVTLSGVGTDGQFELVEIHRAIERLEHARPRTAEVVVLRLLGGLDVEDVAETLDLSPSTVKREWRAGRALLMTLLG